MVCESPSPRSLTALEFYSGIGGMHYALQQAVPGATVLAAFDINEVANLVYQHNSGLKPRLGNVEKVGVARLDKYGADLWLLAPPCQPFTRQGHQRDLGDTRTRSFQRLLSHLAAMRRPPTWLLLENVVGFEGSEARGALLEVLKQLGYSWQEFQLSPQQYGLPYSRPRYFCCATRCPQGLPVQLPDLGAPCCCPPYRLRQLVEQGAGQDQLLKEAAQPTGLRPVRPIHHYLQQHPGEEAEVAPKLAAAPWHVHVMAAAQERRAARRQQVAPEHLPAHVLQHQQQRQQQEHGSKAAVLEAAAGVQQQQHVPVCGDHEQVQEQGSSGRHLCQAAPPQPHLLPAATQDQVGEGEAASHVSSHPLASPQQHAMTAPSPGPPATAPAAAGAAAVEACPGTDHQDKNNPWASFLVPQEVLEHCADVVDVVTGDSTRAMCCTKGYSRNMKGSGSLVATVPLGTPGADPGWYLAGGVHCMHRVLTGVGSKTDADTNRAVKLALADAWATLAPRYMTPREVANLHSFPPAPAFTFPASVTRRQRYRLLGNSLSVEVVADLLRYLLGAPRSAAEGGAQRTSLEQAAAASAKAAAAVAALGGSDTVVGHATARQGQVQQQQHL